MHERNPVGSNLHSKEAQERESAVSCESNLYNQMGYVGKFWFHVYPRTIFM